MLAQHKRNALTHKLESLSEEFKYWEARSDTGKELAKHYSQIRRMSVLMRGFEAQIQARLAAASGDDASVLAECRRLERMILEVHRIWEFFRRKLLLRESSWFRPYLIAADDFAWECYNKFRSQVAASHVAPETRKEPPLVFFNAYSSPFLQGRDKMYEAEAAFEEQMRTPEFIDALKSLPIPVIGIPWFQTQHLPDMPVIGHEVGHAVEGDFKLTPRLTTLLTISGVDQGRLPAWLAWRAEVFADLFGVLTTGPAFVGCLIDFLAFDAVKIRTERRTAANWTTYPTSYLRVLLCLEALSHLGYTIEVQDRKNLWLTTFSDPDDPNSKHAMYEFEEDIPKVVKALLDGPYPELAAPNALAAPKLTAVLNFPPALHTQAISEAVRLLTPTELTNQNVRVLIAAARLAYEKDASGYYERKMVPDEPEAMNVPERVLATIQKWRTGQTRGTRTEDEGRPAAFRKAREASDAALGTTLFKQLFPDESL